jgi:hypothetical protein
VKADHPRSDNAVEDSLRNEIQIAPEQSEIVIRPVEHNRLVRERVAQRRKIDIRQRIDNEIAARNADLKQAKFFAVAVKTVRFGVESDAVD